MSASVVTHTKGYELFSYRKKRTHKTVSAPEVQYALWKDSLKGLKAGLERWLGNEGHVQCGGVF